MGFELIILAMERQAQGKVMAKTRPSVVDKTRTASPGGRLGPPTDKTHLRNLLRLVTAVPIGT